MRPGIYGYLETLTFLVTWSTGSSVYSITYLSAVELVDAAKW